MTRPRISILTPCLNQASVLAQTLESVLQQGYANLEYIIMDGGSTDDSHQIIRQYEDKITHWCSGHNGGVADALNRGLSQCTGDIIAYIQPGQTYLPNTLNLVADLMSGEHAVAWLVGNRQTVDANGRKTHSRETTRPAGLVEYLCGESGYLPHASSFWQTNLFYDYGYFALDLQACFDYEFNCRLLASGEQPQVVDMLLSSQQVTAESRQAQHQINAMTQAIEVAHRYELMLSITDRIKLIRNIGYRQRFSAIQQAKMRTGASLWAKVFTKPWWLASSDIRHALIHPEKVAA